MEVAANAKTLGMVELEESIWKLLVMLYGTVHCLSVLVSNECVSLIACTICTQYTLY